MGFIKKATKKVTAEELKSTDGGGFQGLDAGDYVAKIVDVEIKEYGPNSKNPGTSYLALELSPIENWDGEKVTPEVKIRTGVCLESHWPSSGKLNFTLFQFLKALEGGWDFEEDEALVDFEDEDDAQATLMGETLNIRVGYRVTEPNDRYPTPNVFPDFDRFLLQDADLVPNTRLGTYEEYKAKHVGVAPARAEARSRDTNTKFAL